MKIEEFEKYALECDKKCQDFYQEAWVDFEKNKEKFIHENTKGYIVGNVYELAENGKPRLGMNRFVLDSFDCGQYGEDKKIVLIAKITWLNKESFKTYEKDNFFILGVEKPAKIYLSENQQINHSQENEVENG